MTQLTFDLPPRIALGPEDFFVSGANAAAFAKITDPAGWSDHKLVLSGPQGCGKSHLARVFTAQNEARIVDATTLSDTLTALPLCPCVIEDADRMPVALHEAMFHLHNHLHQHALPLLLTARSFPSRWPVTLPDLATRLQAIPVVRIEDPDDMLMQAVLAKHFTDRQIAPKPQLITYIMRHCERSFAAAAQVVHHIDRLALETGQKPGIKLAGIAIDALNCEKTAQE